MPAPVIERAMTLLPEVDFVNAYGLTETSSTVAVLDPDDHRAAFASDDPEVRPAPGLGGPAAAHARAGDPRHRRSTGAGGDVGRDPGAGRAGVWRVPRRWHREPDDGWFATKDGGHLDAGGFLFVEGRIDDVIVRGGENLSPGEIEEALLSHPAVAEVGVVGAARPRVG